MDELPFDRPTMQSIGPAGWAMYLFRDAPPFLVCFFIAACSSSTPAPIKNRYLFEYAQYHEVSCRRDVPEFCVEVDVALTRIETLALVDREKKRIGSKAQRSIIAVRMNKDRSAEEGRPVISVVFGGYGWVADGNHIGWSPDTEMSPWGGSEAVSDYHLEEDGWTYMDTGTYIYDPV